MTGIYSKGTDIDNIINIGSGSIFGYSLNGSNLLALPYPGTGYDFYTNTTNIQYQGNDLAELFYPKQMQFTGSSAYFNINSACKYIYFILIGNGGDGGAGNGNNGGSGGAGGTCWGYVNIENANNGDLIYTPLFSSNAVDLLIYKGGTNPSNLKQEIYAYNGTNGTYDGPGGIGGSYGETNYSYPSISVAITGQNGSSGSQSDLNMTPSGYYNQFGNGGSKNYPNAYINSSIGDSKGSGGHGSPHHTTPGGYGNPGFMQLWFLY
jgi:hypothetical protein